MGDFFKRLRNRLRGGRKRKAASEDSNRLQSAAVVDQVAAPTGSVALERTADSHTIQETSSAQNVHQTPTERQLADPSAQDAVGEVVSQVSPGAEHKPSPHSSSITDSTRAAEPTVPVTEATGPDSQPASQLPTTYERRTAEPVIIERVHDHYEHRIQPNITHVTDEVVVVKVIQPLIDDSSGTLSAEERAQREQELIRRLEARVNTPSADVQASVRAPDGRQEVSLLDPTPKASDAPVKPAPATEPVEPASDTVSGWGLGAAMASGALPLPY